MNIKHYLITEWNVDMLDLGWLYRRHELFMKFTMPTVLSQTCKDFEWVLVCDERTPDEFKKIFESYPATKLYHNFENYKWGAPEQGSEIMQRSVDLEYIKDVLIDFIGTPKVDCVITSRCDNDDALSKFFIERIQYYANQHWNWEPFWLNLTRGYKYNDGKVYPKNSKANPFISFVEPPIDIKTTYQVCHTEAASTPYEVFLVRHGCPPSWLQVIHKENLLNKVMRYKGERPFSDIKDEFLIRE